MPYKYCSILRNSKDIYFILSIDSDKLILEQYENGIKDTETVLKESVKCFSSDFNSEKNIIYSYVSKDGKLILSSFPTVNRDFEFISVGSSYEITNISLKIVKEDYHLFFVVQEKSTGRASIYRSRYHSGIWNSEKLASLDARIDTPYIIDSYKQFIYFLYNNDEKNEYLLIRYDTELNNWDNWSKKIILSGIENLSFLISSAGTALICHTTNYHNQSEIAIRTLEVENDDAYWSEEEVLSTVECPAFNPSILSFNDNLYVLWEELGLIVFRYLDSEKGKWSPKDVLNILESNIYFSKYISLHPDDYPLKHTNLYINLDKMPRPMIPLINNKKKYDENLFRSSSSISHLNNQELPNNKTDYTTSLRILIESKNRENEEYKRINSNLQKELDYLNKIVKSSGEQIEKLKLQIEFNEKAYRNSLNEMNSRLKLQQDEKERLLNTMNKKVQDLTLIIDEKENIITKLHSLLTEFDSKL